MTDGNIEQEEEYVNPNVTVSYNVGPGHEYMMQAVLTILLGKSLEKEETNN